MLSSIFTTPVAITVWVVCVLAVVVVLGILWFVVWEAKRSNRQESERSNSNATEMGVFNESPGAGTGSARGSDTPSVFVIVPAVDDHDIDEEKYLGGDAHHILESRSSVTEFYMRASHASSRSSEGAVKTGIYKSGKRKSFSGTLHV